MARDVDVAQKLLSKLKLEGTKLDKADEELLERIRALSVDSPSGDPSSVAVRLSQLQLGSEISSADPVAVAEIILLLNGVDLDGAGMQEQPFPGQQGAQQSEGGDSSPYAASQNGTARSNVPQGSGEVTVEAAAGAAFDTHPHVTAAEPARPPRLPVSSFPSVLTALGHAGEDLALLLGLARMLLVYPGGVPREAFVRWYSGHWDAAAADMPPTAKANILSSWAAVVAAATREQLSTAHGSFPQQHQGQRSTETMPPPVPHSPAEPRRQQQEQQQEGWSGGNKQLPASWSSGSPGTSRWATESDRWEPVRDGLRGQEQQKQGFGSSGDPMALASPPSGSPRNSRAAKRSVMDVGGALPSQDGTTAASGPPPPPNLQPVQIPVTRAASQPQPWTARIPVLFPSVGSLPAGGAPSGFATPPVPAFGAARPMGGVGGGTPVGTSGDGSATAAAAAVAAAAGRARGVFGLAPQRQFAGGASDAGATAGSGGSSSGVPQARTAAQPAFVFGAGRSFAGSRSGVSSCTNTSKVGAFAPRPTLGARFTAPMSEPVEMAPEESSFQRGSATTQNASAAASVFVFGAGGPPQPRRQAVRPTVAPTAVVVGINDRAGSGVGTSSSAGSSSIGSGSGSSATDCGNIASGKGSGSSGGSRSGGAAGRGVESSAGVSAASNGGAATSWPKPRYVFSAGTAASAAAAPKPKLRFVFRASASASGTSGATSGAGGGAPSSSGGDGGSSGGGSSGVRGGGLWQPTMAARICRTCGSEITNGEDICPACVLLGRRAPQTAAAAAEVPMFSLGRSDSGRKAAAPMVPKRGVSPSAGRGGGRQQERPAISVQAPPPPPPPAVAGVSFDVPAPGDPVSNGRLPPPPAAAAAASRDEAAATAPPIAAAKASDPHKGGASDTVGQDGEGRTAKPTFVFGAPEPAARQNGSGLARQNRDSVPGVAPSAAFQTPRPVASAAGPATAASTAGLATAYNPFAAINGSPSSSTSSASSSQFFTPTGDGSGRDNGYRDVAGSSGSRGDNGTSPPVGRSPFVFGGGEATPTATAPVGAPPATGGGIGKAPDGSYGSSRGSTARGKGRSNAPPPTRRESSASTGASPLFAFGQAKQGEQQQKQREQAALPIFVFGQANPAEPRQQLPQPPPSQPPPPQQQPPSFVFGQLKGTPSYVFGQPPPQPQRAGSPFVFGQQQPQRSTPSFVFGQQQPQQELQPPQRQMTAPWVAAATNLGDSMSFGAQVLGPAAPAVNGNAAAAPAAAVPAAAAADGEAAAMCAQWQREVERGRAQAAAREAKERQEAEQRRHEAELREAVKDHQEQAKDAYRCSEYVLAEQHYTKALTAAESLAGRNSANAAPTSFARWAASRAAAEGWSDPAAEARTLRLNRAAVWMMLGCYHAAVKDCEVILAESFADQRARLRLGRALLKAGRVEEATAAFDAVVPEEESADEQKEQRATGLQECRKVADKVRAAQVALLEPAVRPERALIHAAAALEFSPNAEAAQVARLQALLDLRRPVEGTAFAAACAVARDVCRDGRSAALARHWAAPRPNRAEPAQVRGSPDPVLVVKALPPAMARLYYRACRGYAASAGSTGDAVADVLQVAAERGDFWAVTLRTKVEAAKRQKGAADAEYAAGRFRRASDGYSRALADGDMEDADEELAATLHLNRAAARIALCQYSAAAHDCAKALDLRPSYHKAHLRHARAYRGLENWATAARHYEKYLAAVAREGGGGGAAETEARSELADCRLQQQRKAQARAAAAAAERRRQEEEEAARRRRRAERNHYYYNFGVDSDGSDGDYGGAGGGYGSFGNSSTVVTHYTTLGVTRGATATEIKQAYRKLALQLHPDKNAATDAHQRFQAVSAAYEVLQDASERRKYDTELRYSRWG